MQSVVRWLWSFTRTIPLMLCFFSSRRRHTRCLSDWSSDVCSSDLYTLDVVAKVTSIRDFFVTLFFVGLGMEIPVPTWNFIRWTIFFCLFLVGSRLLTVFPPLYFLRQGYRISLLPAINLCQMSELSLVLLALGKANGDVS